MRRAMTQPLSSTPASSTMTRSPKSNNSVRMLRVLTCTITWPCGGAWRWGCAASGRSSTSSKGVRTGSRWATQCALCSLTPPPPPRLEASSMACSWPGGMAWPWAGAWRVASTRPSAAMMVAEITEDSRSTPRARLSSAAWLKEKMP